MSNTCKHCGSDIRFNPCCGRVEGIQREFAAAQAEIAEFKYANTELAKHRDKLNLICADWDKAVSALAAMVMRYFNSINYRRTGKGDVADALYDKCVKRGDDDRALVAENARLREERDELKNDLHDFNMVIKHCSHVYRHFSGGVISKPNTYPEEVISIAEDLERERIEEAIKEEMKILTDPVREMIAYIPCCSTISCNDCITNITCRYKLLKQAADRVKELIK